MNLIAILADRIDDECKQNWFCHLLIQKTLIDKYFPWINCKIQGKLLSGSGTVEVAGLKYNVDISYSPFLNNRPDRIFVKGKNIKFDDRIHVYGDLSLCLYHPEYDRPLFSRVSLFQMVPWISEWCVFYEEWKKYGVWLGKEIKH